LAPDSRVLGNDRRTHRILPVSRPVVSATLFILQAQVLARLPFEVSRDKVRDKAIGGSNPRLTKISLLKSNCLQAGPKGPSFVRLVTFPFSAHSGSRERRPSIPSAWGCCRRFPHGNARFRPRRRSSWRCQIFLTQSSLHRLSFAASWSPGSHPAQVCALVEFS